MERTPFRLAAAIGYMIETVVIDNIGGIMEMISDQTFNDEIKRLRSSYFFRGMPDVSFRLSTSLERNCKQLYRELEPAILRNFAKYASIMDPSVNDSVWRAMIGGQHHGLPTRLLDWTISVPMALNFAVSETDYNEMDQNDCVVWRYDVKEINELLPRKYKEALTYAVFTVDDLAKLSDGIKEYDSDMGDSAFITLEPPSIDHRIVNQYSYFTIMPAGITDLEDYLDKKTNKTVRYIIDKSLRWDIRDTLDQWNIS